ncbi:MAG: hypothetical protein ACTHWA_02420 [Arachnia sp.]
MFNIREGGAMDKRFSRKLFRALTGVFVVAVVIILVGVLTGSGEAVEESRDDRSRRCIGGMVDLISSDSMGIDVNKDVISDFSALCPEAFSAYEDYMSIKADAAQIGPDQCSNLERYQVDSAAIRLAERDGHCSDEPH